MRGHRRVARALVRAGLILVSSGVGAGVAGAQAPHINPAWLKVDSASQSAQFDLVAGLTPMNAGMNFNGFSNGQLRVVVPVGWHMTVHFKNQDQNLPHSAMVMHAIIPPPPTAPAAPAFDHGGTHHLGTGLASDAKEDFTFTASQVGAYALFCAVPGHGSAGMWVRFDVSPTATMPSMEVVH